MNFGPAGSFGRELKQANVKKSGVKNSVRKSNVKLTKTNVKLCALCGAMNHEANAECWTCGWHGVFNREPEMIALAWQRLESLYEEVRMEHVTTRRRSLGELGVTAPISFWSAAATRVRSAWQRFQTQRDLQMAQRAASLRSRISSRPDQLGV